MHEASGYPRTTLREAKGFLPIGVNPWVQVLGGEKGYSRHRERQRQEGAGHIWRSGWCAEHEGGRRVDEFIVVGRGGHQGCAS